MDVPPSKGFSPAPQMGPGTENPWVRGGLDIMLCTVDFSSPALSLPSLCVCVTHHRFPPGFGGASFPWQPTPSFPPPLLPSSFFSPSLSPSPFPSPFPSRQLHSGQSGRGRSRVPRHRYRIPVKPIMDTANWLLGACSYNLRQ